MDPKKIRERLNHGDADEYFRAQRDGDDAGEQWASHAATYSEFERMRRIEGTITLARLKCEFPSVPGYIQTHWNGTRHDDGFAGAFVFSACDVYLKTRGSKAARKEQKA